MDKEMCVKYVKDYQQVIRNINSPIKLLFAKIYRE